jgi:anthranilate synthase component I
VERQACAMRMTVSPSYSEFERLSKKGNIVPVHAEVLADLMTPMTAYMNVSRNSRYSFLLESVEGGERAARYSFIGMDPISVFRRRGERFDWDGEKGTGDPLEALRRHFKNFKVAGAEGLPPFIGGGVGYFAYDAVRHIEWLPKTTLDDLSVPDILLMLTDSILIFDHPRHKVKIVCCARIDGRKGLKRLYTEAVDKIHALHGMLRSTYFLEASMRGAPSIKPVKFTSNMPQKRFEEMVRKGKEYIRAGDIFQVVLSQRLSAPVTAQPLDVYRALRSLNPSPYMFYLRLDDISLVGASPEVLVTLRDGEVTVRPIAGTRRRPVDASKEDAVVKDLLADEKERAEHIMLVDLGRNDVGRVAAPGTVRVNDLMTIEKYSHVIHIVSNVTGKLAKGKDAMDVLRGCFPAGTVSGAPKVRAMEIIEELEPTRRGVYAGAVGYLSYTGMLDTCITIRTIMMKDGMAYVQAGAGIVADSVPEKEYEETFSKANALTTAVELANGGLI